MCSHWLFTWFFLYLLYFLYLSDARPDLSRAGRARERAGVKAALARAKAVSRRRPRLSLPYKKQAQRSRRPMHASGGTFSDFFGYYKAYAHAKSPLPETTPSRQSDVSKAQLFVEDVVYSETPTVATLQHALENVSIVIEPSETWEITDMGRKRHRTLPETLALSTLNAGGVVKVGDRVYAYYQSSRPATTLNPDPRQVAQSHYVCLAVSTDGWTFSKPKFNHALLGTNAVIRAPFPIVQFTVIRYDITSLLCFVDGGKRKVQTVYRSQDGIEWKQVSSLTPACWDRCSVGLSPLGHSFLHYRRHNENEKLLKLSKFKDVDDWPDPCPSRVSFARSMRVSVVPSVYAKVLPKPVPFVSADEHDTRYSNPSDHHCGPEVYAVESVVYEGIMVFMVMMTHSGHGRGHPYRGPETALYFGFSNTGREVYRPAPRTPYVQEKYGLYYLQPSPAVVRLGTSMFIYFGAGHGPANSTYARRVTAAGVMRLDGFVSKSASNVEGAIVTKPFRIVKKELRVNYRAHGGMLKVELLSPNGSAVLGYTAAESLALKGDDIDAVVSWDTASTILVADDVRLRFILKNCEIFSFRFT